MDRRRVLAGIVAAPFAAVPLLVPVAASVAPAGALGSGGGQRRPTLVIGHRGAAGYRPEHTLASYELAARLGADFVEPDLVSTRDGVLVCRHEPEIGGTTDVVAHPEFAARRTTKILDGVATTGWFTEDFTLAELKTLRAKERLPEVRPRNTRYDGQSEIPTFTELLDLRARLSRELGREIGVYPETKHPTYFAKAGLPLERRLLDILVRYGLNHRGAPVYVQSFETTNLCELRTLGLRTASVQLLSATGAPFDLVNAGDPRTYQDLSTLAGLWQIARYANGIGPDKLQIIPRAGDGTLGTPTSLVTDAHAAGLVVHPYTFRAENTFLPKDYQVGANPSDLGRAVDEQVAYLKTGIDGLFTDQADIGVRARAVAAGLPNPGPPPAGHHATQ
ncbi:glycerophosphoryl diester phosphodiesterase [Frankia casuarinae]|uniref:glycerophosphodiester phosphodiesterase n=2 Tax=Frankia casuarinae (strain DSM 45818 / CECT 9043 / HFP020203 / CcI3) TaxID=106370 RepID=Q2JA93_FRACC|nr:MULTISPECIES: glycerophosphodiester phosphodiesterase [Frankia]ETA03359.1 glycerophosphoryl diester phosphodiesterase [Frankia sp. CcI6]KDA42746.1 glycerophosphoryl diester phosphodiesterase [Frankia sp. BMG5.23]KFB04180.1 glycerophosphoryl diester phosphodiesterase [Frankia sp. Allo2]OHV56221.1 glycerophosphodiester phosphodiesterase [Frankia sp. CgIS1]ABD11799.1 glycerophosphoryl diester phosphodiesterase [Frankia casuarinae]